MEAVGIDGPVTDEKSSQGSTWRFNLRVVFSCRRSNRLWHFADNFAFRQLVQCLLEDAQALANLFDAHQVAPVAVTQGRGGDVELDALVDRRGVGATDVAVVPGV